MTGLQMLSSAKKYQKALLANSQSGVQLAL